MKQKLAMRVLRYGLGSVILIEAILFLLPNRAYDFPRSHMPAMVRLILGWGEIAGCILLLMPKTAIRGAWLLFAVFIMAILIHWLHGQYNIGCVVIYAAVAFAIAVQG
jgi:uncharacterized membrane protein YphA (DoxX/SURF4 family)